jgi:hypothetical protein
MRIRKRHFAILLAAYASVAACGGRSGTLSLTIVTSPTDDPFGSAANVRITVGDGKTIKTVPVSGGKFSFNIDQKPLAEGDGAIVRVEALDSAGTVIAYGTTPLLSLQPVDQGPYAVWVGRPGTLKPAAAQLPAPRSEMATAAITGLGVLYSGGRDATGAAIAKTCVYDVYTQSILETADLSAVRAGAVGGAITGIRATVFGGAQDAGFGNPKKALATTELFDPTVGVGLWSPLAGDDVDARSQPSLTTLGSGSLLIAGGFDTNGNRLATAALMSTTSSPRLSKISGPMVAARAGHAVAPAKFPDGDGALLFGGLGTGSLEPIVERLVNQSFSTYDLGQGITNRVGATATALADGRVVILGGDDGTGPLASGLVVTPLVPAQVAMLATALSAPRAGHTAIRVGNDILVCGGATTGDEVAASCDLIDGGALTIKETIPMGTGRKDHTAVQLETGPVLITGGTDAKGAPLGSIEIYTPRL